MSLKRSYNNAMAEPRRGKMYSCVHCEAAGKKYVEARYRVTAHIYKHHFALDKAPFYCTLCLLRCSTKSALINHVSKYSRHRLAAAEHRTDDRRYLVENPRPALVELGKDLRELSSLEASLHNSKENTGSSLGWEDDQVPLRSPSIVSQAPLMSPPTTSQAPVNQQSGSGLINIQFTPEMLEKFLQCQQTPVNNSHQKNTMDNSTINMTTGAMYSPSTTSTQVYIPTPIVKDNKTKGNQQNVLYNVPSTDNVSSTKNRSQHVGSLLNTPEINQSTTEDILPGLLGINDNTESEYEFGFNHNWLEIEAGAQTENGNLNSDSGNVEDPLVGTSRVEVATQVEMTSNVEPATKRPRIDDTVTNEEKQDFKLAKVIESVIESGVKQLTDAFEKNSRAVRGVDKTLGQLMEVMSKMNRTLERMGEEQRREHERRREEGQNELSVKRVDENRKEKSRKSEETSRREDYSKKEGKENRTLKSIVNKV